MTTPLTAELEVSLTLHLTGEYQDYIPANRTDPSSGGFCEDLAISAITISLPYMNLETGIRSYRTLNILEGVDTTSSAVQLLLSNLQAAIEDEAQDAMADALPDDDPDYPEDIAYDEDAAIHEWEEKSDD